MKYLFIETYLFEDAKFYLESQYISQMGDQSILFENSTCSCNCSIVPGATFSFSISKSPKEQQILPTSFQINQSKSSYKKQNKNKISISAYKKNREKSTNNLVQKNNKLPPRFTLNKTKDYENLSLKLSPSKRQYYHPITASSFALNKPSIQNAAGIQKTNKPFRFEKMQYNNQVKSNNHSQLNGIFKRQLIKPQNSNVLYYQGIDRKQRLSKNSSKTNLYSDNLSVFSKKAHELSTQTSAFFTAIRQQEHESAHNITESQPSINQKSQQKLTQKHLYFRPIESMKGVTQQSADEISVVLSYDFLRQQPSQKYLNYQEKTSDKPMQQTRKQGNHPSIQLYKRLSIK